MKYIPKQINPEWRQQKTAPLRFTISNFKFNLNPKYPPILKSHSQLPPEPPIQRVVSQQLSRRANSYRLDREKKIERLENQNQPLLFQQMLTEINPSTPVLTFDKKRTQSCKKLSAPVCQVKQEVLRSLNSEFQERIKQQHRMFQIKMDLYSRKGNLRISNRVINQSPIELLTRKLQWEGKIVAKKLSLKRENKMLHKLQNSQRRHHNELQEIRLGGWQGEQSIQYLQCAKFM